MTLLLRSILPITTAIAIGLACLAILIAAKPTEAEINISLPAEAAPLGTPGTITVEGEATVQVVPDTADLQIVLAATAGDSERAHKRLSAKKATLLDGLRTTGLVADERVVATVSSVSPVTEYNNGRERILHYEASLSVTISTTDFDQIDDLARAATSAKARSLSVGFRSTTLDELKTSVRAKALKNAREKAEQMVASVGTSLVRVTSIGENTRGAGWGYNAQSSKQIEVSNLDAVISASNAPLTLAVTIGFELGKLEASRQ